MIDFSKIETIIFDLGGVLFDIDYTRTSDAFVQLGMKNFDAAYSQAAQSQVFDEFEKGNMSNDIFRNFIRENISSQLKDEEIDAAWNAMLIGMEPIKFATLKTLKTKFPLYLLSNTNGIHLPKVFEMIATQTPENSLQASFNHCYFSNQIHLRKPDAEIFEFVMQQNNLQPGKTLFIDDSIQHVEGAKKVGLQAFHLTKDWTIEKLFAQIL
jgi:putative hydrolase of the HAD superfamily